ncbi:MAG: hypothetical protein HC801_06130 [Nitrospira sp.]|nr:hypothetical protein [Nitrospira sp.]
MPLRVRLTLWYGSALALVLIIFSVVLYAMTARNLRDAVDESLEDTATIAVRSLQERGFLPLLNEKELLSQFPELARIDKFSRFSARPVRLPSALRISSTTMFRSAALRLRLRLPDRVFLNRPYTPMSRRCESFRCPSCIGTICCTSCRSGLRWNQSGRLSIGS